MSAVVDTHGHEHGHDHAHDAHGHHGPYGGVMRWITTTNHKDIGTLYLWFAGTMFFVGGMMALVIRLELFHPGLQFVNPDFYNQLVTSHGLITIFAVHILGMISILGSINIITTILNMRAPGMTMMRLPMFIWTWLITAYLLVAAMPVLAGAVTMTLTDRHFGTTFFNAAGGGDP